MTAGDLLLTKTALVLDDDEATSDALSAILEDEGFVVLRAKTIEQARRLIEKGHVALVLVDLVLDGERGRHLLDDLAGHPHAPPMLVVSGADDAARVAYELSIACVRKPFAVEELVAAINVTQTFRIKPEKKNASASGPRPAISINDAGASPASRLSRPRRP